MTQLTFNELDALNQPGSRPSAPQGGTRESTARAAHDINFARCLFWAGLGNQSVRVANINNIVGTFDNDFAAGENITGTFTTTNLETGAVETVNLSVPFNTDNDTTYTDICNALTGGAPLGLASCTPGGSPNRTITLVANDGFELSLSGVAAAGGNNPNYSQVNTDAGVFAGISLHEDREPTGDDGNVVSLYTTGEPVNVHRQGDIIMENTEAQDNTSSLFVILAGADKGKLRSSADADAQAISSITPKTETGAGAKGIVELNLP